MSDPVNLINPTLKKNIPLVLKLMRSEHKEEPGILKSYETYTLTTEEGKKERYALTLTVLQFISDSDKSQFRLDIIEPTVENGGDFGAIFPVVKSIIAKDGEFIFDNSGSYVVKEITADQNALSDKPNKPNWMVRAANREHYLGSEHPTLGIKYGLIKFSSASYLHMNRAQGAPLDSYVNKLSGEQFLALACTLLEEGTRQIHRIVSRGKHQGKTIIHCDLKTNNVMGLWKDNQWTITVVDMGLAKTLKDGKFITQHSHGNEVAMDSKMLLAKRYGQPRTYSIQSDFYGFFVMIAELAGAPIRERSSNKYALKESAKANLNGMFHNMNFDPKIAQPLADIIRRMLWDDETKRATPEEALSVFKKALTAILSNKVESKDVEEPVEPRETTAFDLKECVEIDLDAIISEKEKNGKHKNQPLKRWLSRYRELRSRASEKEISLFDSMLAKNEELSIISFYILDFLRFNLIEEYENDDTCIRLVERHQYLLSIFDDEEIKEEFPLPSDWEMRFAQLVDLLPFQATTHDASQCKEIKLFRQNLSALLQQKADKDTPPILRVLIEQAEQQLDLHVTIWAEQLPALATSFNQKFQCISELFTLFERLVPIFEKNKDLVGQFNELSEQLFDKALLGQLPNDVNEYFNCCHSLASLLMDYEDENERLTSLFEAIPILKHSSFSLKYIEKAIQELQINEIQSVRKLSQKIELLLLVSKVYHCLAEASKKFSAPPRYLALINFNKIQFTHLLTLDLSEAELKTELTSVLKDMEVIYKVDDYSHRLYKFRNIGKAMRLLLESNFKILELGKIIKLDSRVDNYGKLDKGLANLLSQKPHAHLNEQLFAEITRFYAYPKRYIPCDLKVHANANPNTIFPAQALGQSKGEELPPLTLDM